VMSTNINEEKFLKKISQKNSNIFEKRLAMIKIYFFTVIQKYYGSEKDC